MTVYNDAMKFLTAFLVLSGAALAQPEYDLLIKGGHVIDGKNGVNAVRDVAIRDGKIAAVEGEIPAARAHKTVDASGLYVTPGLVDIHVHVYTGTGARNSYAGDNSVYPDGFTFRSGVTTVVDAGGAGWRNFADFKDRVIDRSHTRVLAFLNIVGHGMGGGKIEQNTADMDAKATAARRAEEQGPRGRHQDRALRRPRIGSAVDRAVEAGKIAEHPRDGRFRQLPPRAAVPGSGAQEPAPRRHLHAHVPGLRCPCSTTKASCCPTCSRRASAASSSTSGHGGGSFLWRQAVPAMKQGFIPDSISTDLHIGSMNAGMKDMLNVMSKFLNMGMSLDDVILRSTWNPAREIQREELGHLSVGAPADVAVLRLREGDFGFVDVYGARLKGDRRSSSAS